ncbi:MAG: hypothetical protein IPP17_10260 [Bacteroidetes bacterium]|nr:hypothetical protein [Bacteroidota bacterium]
MSDTSAIVSVSISPNPPAPVITASGPVQFCPGGSVTLTSSSPTGNLWSTGATTQSIIVTTGGTYTVQVVDGLCISDPSNAITVTISPVPPVPTITPGGPTTFCDGGSVVLTTNAPSGRVWQPGGQTTASITVTTSGSYTVMRSNIFGCTSTSLPTVVTVIPLPTTPTITPSGPTALCPGDSVTLTSSSPTGNTWSTGATTQSITVGTVGSYWVRWFDGTCTSDTSADQRGDQSQSANTDDHPQRPDDLLLGRQRDLDIEQRSRQHLEHRRDHTIDHGFCCRQLLGPGQ